MATIYTITLKNFSAYPQDFFFFQKPAEYVGGSLIYANSIYHTKVRPYEKGQSTLTFQLQQQYIAGVEDQAKNLVLGQPSGSSTAYREIETTKKGNNSTNMLVDPLGLEKPTNMAEVPEGGFRINTPAFDSNTQKYNAGMAVKNEVTGTITLSSFTNAEPSKHIDIVPVIFFYVQTGSYEQGSLINYNTSSNSSAECDGTDGTTTFNVEYTKDGKWEVNSHKTVKYPGLTQSMLMDLERERQNRQ